jgi:hypothetical protein
MTVQGKTGRSATTNPLDERIDPYQSLGWTLRSERRTRLGVTDRPPFQLLEVLETRSDFQYEALVVDCQLVESASWPRSALYPSEEPVRESRKRKPPRGPLPSG